MSRWNGISRGMASNNGPLSERPGLAPGAVGRIVPPRIPPPLYVVRAGSIRASFEDAYRFGDPEPHVIKTHGITIC
jgi:hypothetical protein